MRILTVGKRLVALGVIADLAYHAVAETEEAFDLSLPPVELADHLAIALGAAAVAVGVALHLIRHFPRIVDALRD